VRIFAELDYPGLALLMDPTNYFEAHNIDRNHTEKLAFVIPLACWNVFAAPIAWKSPLISLAEGLGVTTN
jgi:hypothetical protein